MSFHSACVGLRRGLDLPCHRLCPRLQSFLGNIHTPQYLLQTNKTRPQVPGNQLTDAVPMLMYDLMHGTAAMVPVKRGGTFQAHSEITGLTEETQLLAWVQGTQHGSGETALALQLFQAMDNMTGSPLLSPVNNDHVDSKRNGVGVVLKEEFVRNVLEVKRVSDRVMSLKLEIEGVMLNVVSGYATQVGCELEEKEILE
ncbi:hypothetical protein QTP86_026006 [Hemibagrus guttatus]|nr:hypothetical protein QTP86_026006 [Hemibagrus guttatus]